MTRFGLTRSSAIAEIENDDRKIVNPCSEPANLHNTTPNGQNIYLKNGS